MKKQWLVGLFLMAALGSARAQTAVADLWYWHFLADDSYGFSVPPNEEETEEDKWALDGSLPTTLQYRHLFPPNRIGELCNELREDDTWLTQFLGPLSPTMSMHWGKCEQTISFSEPSHSVDPLTAQSYYCLTGYHANYQVLDFNNTHHLRQCDGKYRVKVQGGAGHSYNVTLLFFIGRINNYPGIADGQCDVNSYTSITYPHLGTTKFLVGSTGLQLSPYFINGTEQVGQGTVTVRVSGNGWLDVHPSTTDGFFTQHFRYAVTVLSISEH